jgi:hypothetical protein
LLLDTESTGILPSDLEEGSAEKKKARALAAAKLSAKATKKAPVEKATKKAVAVKATKKAKSKK